nr:hypothetical protein [Tanacetum cinerariifolium]
MNPQETQQVIACDEKWVPSIERVKISSINVRLETTMHQKEETFQVGIDVIKNSTCFKAFTITAKVPVIFMQKFWYTIKKVKDSDSYEFLLANKKFIVDVEVFRKILDICSRVEGEEFTEVKVHKGRRLRTASRRVVKKKVIIFAAENIILDPDVALELGKSISLTEAVEEEAARYVHATHARIVIESVPEHARRRPSGIAFIDTSRVSKKVSSNLSQKLKGVQSLTLKEQEATDTMQALKESKKTSKRQPSTRGSSEGTGKILGVPDESIVFSATSSEGTGTIPWAPDEEKVTYEENFILKWGSE